MPMYNELYVTVLADFFNSQVVLSRTLEDASFGCSEELININIAAVKAGLAESTVFTHQLVTADNAVDRFELISSRIRARIENTLSLKQRISDTMFKAQFQISEAVQKQIESV